MLANTPDLIARYEQLRRELDERFKLVTVGIEIPEDRLTAFSLDAECQQIDSELCTLEDLLPEEAWAHAADGLSPQSLVCIVQPPVPWVLSGL